MRTFLAVIAIVFGLSLTVPAQKPSEFQKRISAAVRDRDYVLAISELRDLQNSDKNIFEVNNYDYLLARLLERSGDLAGAMVSYQRVASRVSILKPYAVWHLSQLARASGNLVLERIYIQEPTAFTQGSLLRSAAENRLARSYFESGEYAEAIRSLGAMRQPRPVSGSAADAAISRENLVLLAQSHLQLGQAAEARSHFAKILNEMANPAQPDDFALAAVEGLDQIDGRAGGADISDYEHLRRASVYHFNRRFENSRRHYQFVISKFPQSGIVPDAMFQIGRAYAQQGEFLEANNWFERTQEQYPGHALAKDALLQAASAYSRLGTYKESIARYKKFIQTFPEDERLDRAYLNIVDILRDSGQENDALSWSQKTQALFRSRPPEAVALFSDVRLYIAREAWETALTALDKLKSFDDLGGIKVPGGTNISEVTFLRGYMLEQLQRFPEAIDTYLSVPDGRNEYYGWRATERLRMLSSDQKARPFVEQKIAALSADSKTKNAETTARNFHSLIRLSDSESERATHLETLRIIYRSLPGYKVPSFSPVPLGRSKLLERAEQSASGRRIADELFFLGLYDEGTPEMAAVLKGTSGPNISYSLADSFRRGDIANRATAFIEPIWRNIPTDYQVELIPRSQLELLYPAPYADALLKHAPPRGVDPRFILSIMRQESRFQPDIKSYAAARGLMQFISPTADTVAAKLGRRSVRNEDLYDPSTAILFGSQYLADLFQAFPGQAPAVAASYNGGDDNMKRWMMRSRSDKADQYVSEILFTQSKDYVYKVMSNYRLYRYLYDENLKPAF